MEKIGHKDCTIATDSTGTLSYLCLGSHHSGFYPDNIYERRVQEPVKEGVTISRDAIFIDKPYYSLMEAIGTAGSAILYHIYLILGDDHLKNAITFAYDDSLCIAAMDKEHLEKFSSE